MSISRLSLRNFRKHRNLDISFGPTTLIIGPNGSGKSTIIEAIRFALVGAINSDLKDAITAGSSEAFVELHFDDGLVVRRRIDKRGSYAGLEHDGNTVSGVSAVTKYILDHFDISEEAIQVLLSRQEAMCEFFMEAEAKRVGTVSSLIPGVSIIKSRYDWLTDALSSYPDYGTLEPTSEEKVRQLQNKLNEVEAKLNELKKRRNDALARQYVARDKARAAELSRLLALNQHELREVDRSAAKIESVLAELQTKLKALTYKIQKIETQAADLARQNELRKAYQTVMEDMTHKIATEPRFEDMKEVLAPLVSELLGWFIPPPVDTTVLDELAALRQEEQTLSQSKQSFETEAAILRNRKSRLMSDGCSLQSRINAIMMPQEELPSDENVEELVAKTDSMMSEMARLCEELSKEKRLLQMSQYQKKRDYINQLRDVFHWRNISMQASTFILDNLVDDINDYLALLEVPFRVKTKEGSMTLTAVFGDTELPDQLLSGGQRVAVSIAMKLAILRLLGGKFRFIALDEPTAFLDNARIAGLRELMRRTNEVCRNEGTKLIVISHCPEIQSAFDNVVQLG